MKVKEHEIVKLNSNNETKAAVTINDYTFYMHGESHVLLQESDRLLTWCLLENFNKGYKIEVGDEILNKDELTIETVVHITKKTILTAAHDGIKIRECNKIFGINDGTVIVKFIPLGYYEQDDRETIKNRIQRVSLEFAVQNLNLIRECLDYLYGHDLIHEDNLIPEIEGLDCSAYYCVSNILKAADNEFLIKHMPYFLKLFPMRNLDLIPMQ